MAKKLKMAVEEMVHEDWIDQEQGKEIEDLFGALDKKSKQGLITLKEVQLGEYDSLDTLEELFVEWETRKGSTEQSIRFYKYQFNRLRQFYDYLGNGEKAKYPIRLLAHMNFMTQYKDWLENVKGNKEQTLKSNIAAYRVIYNFCSVEHNWLPKRDLRMKFGEAPIHPIYTDEQIDKLLEKPSKDAEFYQVRNWVIVNLVLNTGLRCGSVSAITMGDLELDDGYILIQHTKRRKVQRIAVPYKMCKIIKNYIADWRKDATQEEYLFCTQFGERISDRHMSGTINDYIHKRLSDYELGDHCGMHSLRHYFAANFVRDGGSLYDLKKQLGHSNIRQSLWYADHYGEARVSDIEEHAIINKRKEKVGRKKIKKS